MRFFFLRSEREVGGRERESEAGGGERIFNFAIQREIEDGFVGEGRFNEMEGPVPKN